LGTLKKNRINFLSSGLQAIAVQILGVAFFYFISLYLNKEDFGLISWSNAVASLITTILSFGLEQVVIRRVAASRSDWAGLAYLIHAAIGSLLSFFILYCLSLWKTHSAALDILPWIFLAQALVYTASPLKQLLNAKEKFTPYAIIAIITNIIKLLAAGALVFNHSFTVRNVVNILIATAVIEFGALSVYVFLKERPYLDFKFKAYKKLLKEAFPQYLAVLFDSSLSRIDWILLGLIGSNVATADYSFAYRAYEVAKLPLVVIGPLLLPVFSRVFNYGEQVDDHQKQRIHHLYSFEIFVAIGIILVANIAWSPWVGALTSGKYGDSNALVFLILSVCLPLHFTINLCWTLCFAARKYKEVTRITIVTATANLILNLIFIPLWGGLGAAVAYSIATLLQAILYYRKLGRSILRLPLKPLVFMTALFLMIYFLTWKLIDNSWLALALGIPAYVMIALATKLINKEQLETVKTYFRK
jgi:O-antigen/teichoic acid export membrane protein